MRRTLAFKFIKQFLKERAALTSGREVNLDSFDKSKAPYAITGIGSFLGEGHKSIFG